MKRLLSVLGVALMLAASPVAFARGGGGHGGRSGRAKSAKVKTAKVKKGKAATGTGSNPSTETVSAYNTKSGKHVSSHRRTKANDTQKDNFGTKGNTNPYTGKEGTKTATH